MFVFSYGSSSRNNYNRGCSQTQKEEIEKEKVMFVCNNGLKKHAFNKLKFLFVFHR